MATPQIVTVRDFTTSRYAQLAENTEGQLTDILARAEEVVQSFLGRDLKETTYTEVMRPSSQTFFVKNRPITSVTSIKRRPNILFSWDLMDLSRVVVENGPGYVTSYLPITNYDVEIVYSAGFVTIPEDIKEAIIMQAVLLSFQDLEVYGAGDARAPGILYMIQDVERILRPYKATASVYH